MQDKHIPVGEFRDDLYLVLKPCVGSDYAHSLSHCDGFFDEVREDVELCSAWRDEGFYNDDDVRLAVGRAIMRAFHCWEY